MTNTTTQQQTPDPSNVYVVNKDNLLKIAYRKQDSLNEKKECPLKAEKIAIFPVRYAIDENPLIASFKDKAPELEDWKNLANPKGMYTRKDWPNKDLPALKTREYTLRQLRKGWLYIWTAQDDWQEFEIKPAQDVNSLPKFIKVDLNNNKEKDQRPAQGISKTFIEVSNHTDIYLLFSSVQLTWRLLEPLLKAGKENNLATLAKQNSLIRVVTPPSCANSNQKHPHLGLLKEANVYIGDVFSDQPLNAYNSTMTLALSNPPDNEIKVERERVSSVAYDNLIATADDPESTLIVALDDPLAIIDDLLFNLSYPITAKDTYETANQRKTQIAEIGYPLIGLGVDDFLPDVVAKDPVQKYEYLKDLYTTQFMTGGYAGYCDDIESRNNAITNEANAGSPPIPNFGNGSRLQYQTTQKFNAIWGSKGGLPKGQITVDTPDGKKKTITWTDKLIEWDQLSSLRRHYNIKESLEHLRDRAIALKIYDECIDLAVQDALVWLDKLSVDAESIYMDTTNAAQSIELYTYADKIITLLQKNDKGHNWLISQFREPTKLFGLTLFNFNKKLYKLFVKLAAEMSKDPATSGAGQVKANKDLNYNIFSRVNDFVGVLSNEHLQKLTLFKELDQVTKETYYVLQKMNIFPKLGKLYENFILKSSLFFTFLKAPEILPYACVVTLAPGDTHIYKSYRFNNDFLKWLEEVHDLESRIETLSERNRKLSSQGKTDKATHQANKAEIAANKQQRQQLKLALERKMAQKPITFIALDTSTQTFNGTEDFFYRQSGQQEAIDRTWMRAQSALKLKQNIKNFVDKFSNKINQYKGSILPSALVLWNIYNTKEAIAKAQQHTNLKNIANVTSNIAYLGNAVMSVWAGPMWERYYKAAATTIGKQNAKILARQSGEKLLKLTVHNLTRHRSALAVLAPKIIMRIGVLNVLLGVAAWTEIIYSWGDVDSSSNQYEAVGQYIKRGSLIVTASIGTLAVGNGILFLLFDCAWIFGPWAAVALFVAGLVYLAASIWNMYFHRTGIALWLDNCIWGTQKKWPTSSETDQIAELKALYKIILQPSVLITQTRKDLGYQIDGIQMNRAYYTYKTTGFWLQIALPAELKDQPINVDTLLVQGNGLLWNTVLKEQYQHTMSRIGNNGVWTSPLAIEHLGKDLPQDPQTEAERTPDFYDYDSHQGVERYIYTVWIPFEQNITTFLSLRLNMLVSIKQQASFLNAPILGDEPEKEQLSYSYQGQLTTGTIKHLMRSDKVAQETLEEAEENPEDYYINQNRFKNDIVSYQFKVGQPDGKKLL